MLSPSSHVLENEGPTIDISKDEAIEALKHKYEMEINFKNEDREIAESQHEKEILELEDKWITAEKDASDCEKEKLRYQKLLEAERQKSREFEKSSISYQLQLENLQSKIFASFNCSSIDELWRIADIFGRQEHRIQELQQTLARMQDDLLTATAKTAKLEAADDVPLLKERLLEAELREQKYRQEIDRLKVDLTRCQQIQGIGVAQKDVEIQRLQQESASLQSAHERLVKEMYDLKAQQPHKRLKLLTYIAQRLNPTFLSLEKGSSMYRMFNSLSSLLNILPDLETDNEMIRRHLVDISEHSGNVSSRFIPPPPDNDARLKSLQEQLHEETARRVELEDEVAALNEELEDMRENDKAVEVLPLMMRIKELNSQIQTLQKKLQEQPPPVAPIPKRNVKRIHYEDPQQM